MGLAARKYAKQQDWAAGLTVGVRGVSGGRGGLTRSARSRASLHSAEPTLLARTAPSSLRRDASRESCSCASRGHPARARPSPEATSCSIVNSRMWPCPASRFAKIIDAPVDEGRLQKRTCCRTSLCHPCKLLRRRTLRSIGRKRAELCSPMGDPRRASSYETIAACSRGGHSRLIQKPSRRDP